MVDSIRSLPTRAYLALAGLELKKREEGQALVEYALILALIAVVSIAALTTLGGNVATQLGNIASAIGGA